MPSGIVHSKLSKRLLGKQYSYVHAHMDSPSKGVLKWRHRIIRHNPFIHPVYYIVKHRNLGAGLACLQHIIQDYYTIFLSWIILLLVSERFGLFVQVLAITLAVIFMITFLNFIFEVVWLTPVTIGKSGIRLIRKVIGI